MCYLYTSLILTKPHPISGYDAKKTSILTAKLANGAILPTKLSPEALVGAGGKFDSHVVKTISTAEPEYIVASPGPLGPIIAFGVEPVQMVICYDASCTNLKQVSLDSSTRLISSAYYQTIAVSDEGAPVILTQSQDRAVKASFCSDAKCTNIVQKEKEFGGFVSRAVLLNTRGGSGLRLFFTISSGLASINRHVVHTSTVASTSAGISDRTEINIGLNSDDSIHNIKATMIAQSILLLVSTSTGLGLHVCQDKACGSLSTYTVSNDKIDAWGNELALAVDEMSSTVYIAYIDDSISEFKAVRCALNSNSDFVCSQLFTADNYDRIANVWVQPSGFAYFYNTVNVALAQEASAIRCADLDCATVLRANNRKPSTQMFKRSAIKTPHGITLIYEDDDKLKTYTCHEWFC